MMKRLKSERGEFVLNSSLELLLVVLCIALVISVFGTIFQANKLSTIANDLTRQIELAGQVVPADYEASLDSLAAHAGLDRSRLSVSVDPVGKVQFGDSFVVELQYAGSLKLGGVFEITIPLHSSVTGRSEVYWK